MPKQISIFGASTFGWFGWFVGQFVDDFLFEYFLIVCVIDVHVYLVAYMFDWLVVSNVLIFTPDPWGNDPI